MTARDTDLLQLDAVELSEAFRAREISPVEVVSTMLEAAESTQPTLNAFALLERERSLRAARDAEHRWLRGTPLSDLDGVPVSLKDNLYVQDVATRFGSHTVSQDEQLRADCPSAARLREAGAVLFGKTTTPEYAHKMVTNSSLTGVTRNPWSLRHTPGGSSGGAAAAVSAGLGPVAIGTDAAGSIRIPAAWTGTFGFKPSLGRVPHHPRGAYDSFSHVGPITRTVTDAVRTLTVLSKVDSRDWYSLPHAEINCEHMLQGTLAGVRIAFSPRLGLQTLAVETQIAAAVQRAAALMESLGARVDQIDPPSMQECIDVAGTLLLSLSARLVRRLGAHAALLDRSLVALAEAGERLDGQSIIDAVVRRAELGTRINEFFERFDLVLSPVIPFGPPALHEIDVRNDLHPTLTQWCNLVGLPAASICCGVSREGLPIGLHIAGRRWGDEDVLRASYAYERASSPDRRRYPWAS